MSGKNTSKTNISLDLSNKNFRYVLETVNEKTVQAAAKKLYISQPSLSRFIKNLEAQIGIDLFDRIDGRLILTEAGRRYVEYARKICALEDEAEKAMEQLRLEHREKLRLGIPDYWASFIIPPLVSTLYQYLPQVELEITDVDSRTLENLLLSGEVDFIISRRLINQELISSRLLRRDPIFLAATPAKAPLIRTAGLTEEGYPIIDLAELSRLRYILPYPGQSLRKQVDIIFRDAHVTPDVVLHCRSVAASMRMAGDGVAACFMSYTNLRYAGPETLPPFFAIDHPNAYLTMCLSHLKDRALPPYMLQFIDLVASCL